MSFDVNVLSSKPVIKAAANMQNDGGGGNLGYMSQERDERNKKDSTDIFSLAKEQKDAFNKSNPDIDYSEINIFRIFTDFINKIKKFFNLS